MTRTLYAADDTWLRLREGAILAEAKSIDTINVEVVCGNWRVLVRGAVGTTTRQWYSLEVDWEDIQQNDDNPLIEAVCRVSDRLRETLNPPRKPGRRK